MRAPSFPSPRRWLGLGLGLGWVRVRGRVRVRVGVGVRVRVRLRLRLRLRLRVTNPNANPNPNQAGVRLAAHAYVPGSRRAPTPRRTSCHRDDLRLLLLPEVEGLQPTAPHQQ